MLLRCNPAFDDTVCIKMAMSEHFVCLFRITSEVAKTIILAKVEKNRNAQEIKLF